ncbi:MAG: carboxypeptidase-like regulatory domain-containing protein [Paraprevotella sp.]|nr:carboxypeptidase-like regulatory domain-containing protein [Paraprevotella sp.]
MGLGVLLWSMAAWPGESLRGQNVETLKKIQPRAASQDDAAHIQIKGVVVDKETGETMIGVSIRVQGTNVVAVTDVDGAYTLNLPAGHYKVTFSYMGYDPVELDLHTAHADNFKRVVMAPASKKMEEVVVTGIYQRKKESFTGSATTFKGSELKLVGVQNVLQSLKTLDPSFKIADNIQFGSDPNRMPDIEIRGKSSIMGLKEEYGTDPNQPLFILDGFETDLQTVSDLNMNRVASVTILKDAASTAIYGSKAANGVVVIETVKPEKGRLRLSYKGDFSVTAADLTDYNLMDASEKLQFEQLAGVYTDKTNSPLNQLKLDSLLNERKKEVARGVNTYWLSEPLRTGFTQKHNVYAEGGEN